MVIAPSILKAYHNPWTGNSCEPVQWDGIGVFFKTHLFEVKQPLTATVAAIFGVTGIWDDSTKCEQWMWVDRQASLSSDDRAMSCFPSYFHVAAWICPGCWAGLKIPHSFHSFTEFMSKDGGSKTLVAMIFMIFMSGDPSEADLELFSIRA